MAASAAGNLPPGWVLIDSGASKSVASLDTLEEWCLELEKRHHSDQVCVRDDRMVCDFRFGNGERARSTAKGSFPVVFGGRAGALGIHGIDSEKVPPLLGIDALETLGALINFEAGSVHQLDHSGQLRSITSRRLPSGHLAVNLLEPGSREQLDRAWQALDRARSAAADQWQSGAAPKGQPPLPAPQKNWQGVCTVSKTHLTLPTNLSVMKWGGGCG